MVISDKASAKLAYLTKQQTILQSILTESGGGTEDGAPFEAAAAAVDKAMSHNEELYKMQDKAAIQAVREAILDLVGGPFRRVDGIICNGDMTLEELMTYETNDPRLVSQGKSWAVVKLDTSGLEIITCGGKFYQEFVAIEEGQPVTNDQTGPTDLLQRELIKRAATEKARRKEICFDLSRASDYRTYTENGVTYYVVPTPIKSLWQVLFTACAKTLPSGSESLTSLANRFVDIWSDSVDFSQIANAIVNYTNVPDGMLTYWDNVHLVVPENNFESVPAGLLVPVEFANEYPIFKVQYLNSLNWKSSYALKSDFYKKGMIIATTDEMWKGITCD